MQKFGIQFGNLAEILRIFGNLEKIEIWKQKFGNLKKVLEIWKKKFGNLEKIWKFVKYLETIWKFGKLLKISKKIGNLEKFWKLVRIWKFGENLEIWKKFGNLKKKIESRKTKLEICNQEEIWGGN